MLIVLDLMSMIFVALMNVSNHGEFDKITMILVKFQSFSFAKIT